MQVSGSFHWIGWEHYYCRLRTRGTQKTRYWLLTEQ
jgi:hypothetical protein